MPLEAESEQVVGQGGSGRLLLGTQFPYFTSTKLQMLTQKRLLVVGRGVSELWTVVGGLEGGGGQGDCRRRQHVWKQGRWECVWHQCGGGRFSQCPGML